MEANPPARSLVCHLEGNECWTRASHHPAKRPQQVLAICLKVGRSKKEHVLNAIREMHAARWPPSNEERLDSLRQTSHRPTVQNRPSNMQGSHPRGCCDEPGSLIDGGIGRQVPYMSQESLPYASCASGVVPNQGFVNLTLTSQ